MPTSTACRTHRRAPRTVLLGAIALLAAGCTTSGPPVVPSGDALWTRQFGTGSDDRAYATAVGADGRVLVAGFTEGALAGGNAGDADAFVRAYAADGATVAWTRQFGTVGAEFAYGLAATPDGGAVVVGSTTGALAGPNAGSEDVFVRAYDGDGAVVWTRQLGSAGSDTGYGVAVGADGRVAVAAATTGVVEGAGFGGVDAFVHVLDASGDVLWTRQFGTAGSEYALGVAVADDGRVWVVGHTNGDLEGANAGAADAFVRAYDADGDLRWTRQFGTAAADVATGGVAVDALGRSFVAGRTAGALDGPSAGGEDAFVRSFDADGALRWGRQFGTAAGDDVGQVVVDDAGRAYVVGDTDGDLEGGSLGFADAFVRAFDAAGAARWTRQFGSAANDRAAAGALAAGRLAVAGHTSGDLAGPNAGSLDGFVRVFQP